MGRNNKFNNTNKRPVILVSPLDWGLGHATRCIPIIHELLNHQCIVIIGGSGLSLKLLKEEFPNLQSIELPAYNITYANKGKHLILKLLSQLPKIIITVFKEHLLLQKLVKLHHIDGVISDNRFGLYSKNVKSVYITHQLNIKTGNSLSERLFKIFHSRVIKNYERCWIPDSRVNGLAGALSHTESLPKNHQFIGPISRFELLEREVVYDLLFILSGPEPQRTFLERKIVSSLEKFEGKVLLIRGTIVGEVLKENRNFETLNFVTSKKLNELVAMSRLVICRSGYTSVMDLVKMNKNAILIPTPGQTEQEYLAFHLKEKKFFNSLGQEDFGQIDLLLTQVYEINNLANTFDWEEYKGSVIDFISSLDNLNY